MLFRIIINQPDPQRERGPTPGPRSKHLWSNGRCYPDRDTAERVCLDLVERGIVRNATYEEVPE